MKQLLQPVKNDAAAKVPSLNNDLSNQNEKEKKHGSAEQNSSWITIKQNKEVKNSGKETWDISMLFL